MKTIYPAYMFKTHDPVLDAVDTAVADTGETRARVARDSGVSATTLGNWHKRKTRRPQFATVAAVVNSLGKELVVNSDGVVIRSRRKR